MYSFKRAGDRLQTVCFTSKEPTLERCCSVFLESGQHLFCVPVRPLIHVIEVRAGSDSVGTRNGSSFCLSLYEQKNESFCDSAWKCRTYCRSLFLRFDKNVTKVIKNQKNLLTKVFSDGIICKLPPKRQ